MTDAAPPVRRATELFFNAAFRLGWGVRIEGLERIPREGPVIVACNHVSLADPLLLGVATRYARRPRFLGKRELFQNPLMRWFLLGNGNIPLDRGSADHGALRTALQVLQGGGSLAIFPEGTRVRPGERRAPKTGVSFLAARSRATVVPARVTGTEAFPRARPLGVRFGDPLPPPGEGREAAAEFAKTVMERIYSL